RPTLILGWNQETGGPSSTLRWGKFGENLDLRPLYPNALHLLPPPPGSARMDHQSEMCATPNDQPGDQKNQQQKNRRRESQPARKPAPLVDLRKISDRSYVRRVSSTEAIKRQDSRDDAAVNQNVRNESYCREDIEKEV